MTHATATPAQWVAGARPRTLPAAVAPVAAGTGAAFALDAGSWPRALLALVVALALQVAVNYANDYSDGVRGTDADRVGPLRLVGSGLASPAAVRGAAVLAFAVAALAGLALVALSGRWWLLGVGAACVVAAWYYTGGRSPYGYRGLGEVFVFVFFGLVAVLGTTYTQAGTVSWAALAAACGVGALVCDVLVANNLRDVPTDAVAGKRTLAVRLGEPRTRVLFAALVGAGLLSAPLAALAAGSWWPLLGLVAAPLALGPARAVLGGATGRDLVPVLGATGKVVLAHGLLLGLGLGLS
ncbi:1,4-dihydroxy-2-naphthoate polyprenyltransferase [Thalassiella azotivora]